MSEVTVRPETPDDIESVVTILETVGAEKRWIGTEVPFDRAARAAEMRRALDDPETFAAFVADAAGAGVIGSIGLTLAPYGVVEFGMAILDGYRGEGIGPRLLECGIEWARRVGAHKMALQVWPHNERAIALYRKVGFVEEGRLQRHYRRRDGEIWDALIMGLHLDQTP